MTTVPSTTEHLPQYDSHRARSWGRGIATVWVCYQFGVFSAEGAAGWYGGAVALGVDLVLIATIVAAWRWEGIGSIVLMLEGAAWLVFFVIQGIANPGAVELGSVLLVALVFAPIFSGLPILAGALLRHDFRQGHRGEPGSHSP